MFEPSGSGRFIPTHSIFNGKINEKFRRQDSFLYYSKNRICSINPGGLHLTTELCKNHNQKDFAHQHLHEPNACKSTSNMQRQQSDAHGHTHLCQQAQPPLTLKLGSTCASVGDDGDALAAPECVI